MGAADYIEIVFTLPRPGSVQQDLLIAGLAEAGYESFLETETGFNAYIRQNDFSERLLRKAIDETNRIFVDEAASGEGAGNGKPGGIIPGEPAAGDEAAAGHFGQGPGAPAFAYEIKLIESRNWNQVWESNFSPVVIGKKCRIRASFHEPDPSFALEIQIDPKMSFGTGHHETTWLMASWLLDIVVKDERVLDMGCGTGVLAIIAAKMGASDVLGADIDPVCIESAVENAAINGVRFRSELSDVNTLADSGFDLILANINRNVLLKHLPFYAEKLNPGGILLLSGFYEGEDLEMLRVKAEGSGLTYQESRTRNRWAAAQFLNA